MSVKIEFGDFQTPNNLCEQICGILAESHYLPASIVEPTCGTGTFLRASARAFPNCNSIFGFEINAEYVEAANSIEGVSVTHANFFTTDWAGVFRNLPEPILVIGNFPWVTNSSIGSLSGFNLPEKSNFMHLKGIDAITGKSNFDISEWMLLRLLETLSGRSATLAMLCKTTVARKVLRSAWRSNFQIGKAFTRPIDAFNHFGAAVDACLFVCVLNKGASSRECAVYPNLHAEVPSSEITLKNGGLVYNSQDAHTYESLDGKSPLKWRSGVKHDCSKVMELRHVRGKFQNGLGETFDIENDFVYPMLKSSDLSKSVWPPSRYMLVTQQTTGEDITRIKDDAPLTWRYLQDHAYYLDKRKSIIYRNRPRFSVFGVGKYAFAPWKVAISGFYKTLNFCVVGPVSEKPVVLDDTGYFLPFSSKVNAESVAGMLHSEPAQAFLRCRVFWDAKRPITAGILQSLDLAVLSKQLGVTLPRPYE